jgi:hypothetical protein
MEGSVLENVLEVVVDVKQVLIACWRRGKSVQATSGDDQLIGGIGKV